MLCSCVNLRAGGDTWLDAFLSPWHCSYLTVSIINASLCPTCWRCEIDLSPWPAVLLTQAPAIAPCPTLQFPALGRTYSNLPWPARKSDPTVLHYLSSERTTSPLICCLLNAVREKWAIPDDLKWISMIKAERWTQPVNYLKACERNVTQHNNNNTSNERIRKMSPLSHSCEGNW